MQEEIKQITAIYQVVTEFLVTYSFQIIGALVILLVGLFIAKKVSNVTLALCERKNLDVTLSHFIANVVRIIVVTFIAIIALSKVGISVTPFIAAVGALSLGAGLAVQGLLSNYSAGLNIILTRPFIVGDTIEVQGVSGQVKEIRLAYTMLSDEDDVIITIPNRHIVGEIIHNSQSDTLVEATIGIAYHCNPEKAIDTIIHALHSLDAINHTRQPQVGIEGFGDSSIDLCARVWVPTKQFHTLRYQINLCIFNALTQNGFDIPFPQREVTLLQEKTT